jgi:rod shape-determining protein MreD
MIEQPANAYWVIVCSLLLAMVLALVPVRLPLAWLRPEWTALVLLYWAIALPERVGVFTAASVGLVEDVLEGALLGQNMLALSLMVLLAHLLYERLRVFSGLQQSLVVFVLIGMHQLLCQWVQTLEGAGAASALFLLPALSSALLWPPLMLGLRAVRRYYEVS